MSNATWILRIAERLKPVLVQVLPIEWLSRQKEKYMNKKTAQLQEEVIQAYAPEKFLEGMNLIANIKADTGLGQSSRLLAGALQKSGISFSIYDSHRTKKKHRTDHSYDEKVSMELPYGINLIHINPNEFVASYHELGKKIWDYHYNIAFWLWELEEFPDEWTGCISVLDEIWTPAEFVSESIRKKTDKPVKTMPYYITAPTETKYDRAYFGLPENCFLFLMMYDTGSMMERKNPIGCLNAFKKAFSKEERVGIVIKIHSATPEELEAIRKELEGYTKVYFITDTFTKVEVNSLIACVDVFVSLHRAEGFGLVLAEAMLVGTPTIATNWSANTEFMNSDVACMVDYDFITIEKTIGPFRKGCRWADPKVEQAAEYMKRLYEDLEYYQQIKEKAQNFMQNEWNQSHVMQRMQQRIQEIQNKREE